MTDANQQSKTELLAVQLDAVPETGADPELIEQAAAELRRLLAENTALRSCAIKYLKWLNIKDPEKSLDGDLVDPEMLT